MPTAKWWRLPLVGGSGENDAPADSAVSQRPAQDADPANSAQDGWFTEKITAGVNAAPTRVSAAFLNGLSGAIRKLFIDSGVETGYSPAVIAAVNNATDRKLADAVQRTVAPIEQLYSSSGVTSGSYNLPAGKAFSQYRLLIFVINQERGGSFAANRNAGFIVTPADFQSYPVGTQESEGDDGDTAVTRVSDTSFSVAASTNTAGLRAIRGVV